MNWLSENLGISQIVQQRLLASLVIVVGLAVLRWLILRTVQRNVDDAEVWFRVRKAVTYVVTIVAFVVLGRIWLSGFGDLATYLGLLSAGLAIALADVLKNLAGWMFIIVRRPFKLGDRIEIGADSGDVIDIRVFRFSLLEIRNWVDADQSTGRIVHVPNGRVFTESMANFSEGFSFIWHEIPFLITFESDWERGEEMLRRVLAEHAPSRHEMAESDIRRASAHYFIRYRHLTPTVYVSVRDSGVRLTGRLLVSVRERRAIDNAVWRALLKELAADPSVELAYPTVRTFLHDPIRLEGTGRPEPGSGASSDGPPSG